MSSFAAMASLNAIPGTLCNPSIGPYTTSNTRTSIHQTRLLNRTTHVFRAVASRHHANRKVAENSMEGCFARISSATTSTSGETASATVSPHLSAPPPPSSQFGSPLFWIGVGVGFSALFSWVSSKLKNYAMQQAYKAMMGKTNPQNNQFNDSTFSPHFPFPMPPPSGPATPPPPDVYRTSATVDVPMTNVQQTPSAKPASTTTVDNKDGAELKKEPSKYELDANKESRKYAFVDVSPEETDLRSPFESVKGVEETSSSKDAQSVGENGAASKQGEGSFTGPQSNRPVMSVESLEKMMEDPTVQKMVFPHLPAEMRDPVTFK